MPPYDRRGGFYTDSKLRAIQADSSGRSPPQRSFAPKPHDFRYPLP
jgi:hypothetical protein